jgi:hypothetical protein
MLSKMILHTLLGAIVVSALAFAYQASSDGGGLADATSGFSRSVDHGDDGHEDD